MNCEIWEEQIAYFVDGDPASPALTAHLSSCPHCQALLEGLRSDQCALRAVPAPDKPKRPVRYATAAALAIAAGLALFYLWPKPPPPPLPTVAQVAAPQRPVKPAPTAVKRHAKPKPARVPTWEEFLDEFERPPQPPAPQWEPPTPDQHLAVRIPTSDPDVIILMIEPRGTNE